MHAPDRSGSISAELGVQRERRLLASILLGLLLTTAAVCPLAFGNLTLLFLLCVPFAVAVLTVTLLAPLAQSPQQAIQAQRRAQVVQSERRVAAAAHAIRSPRVDTLVHDDPTSLAASVASAANHGIHFGCAHLSDEDFLQAFHACEVPASRFRHGDHLRYTVLMVQRLPGGLVEETIGQNLRTFLRQVCGSEALFHATRTHAWIALVRALPRASFSQLLQQHGHTLHGDALSQYYSCNLLESDSARQRAATPDLKPLPPPQAPINSRT